MTTTDCKERFRELVHPQERILDEDLASLQKMPDSTRIERYNTLKSNEEEFLWEFTKDCPDFLTSEEEDVVRSKFRLARLLIAASLYDEGDLPRALEDDFIDEEMEAVVDFDRYKKFDALTEDQIEEKIRRMEGEVYELVKEYTSTQIANMDDLMDNPEVQQDVMERLLRRYEERREKIRQGFFIYVETHGLEHMVESIEDAVKAVADASRERETIREELRKELEDLSETVESEIRNQHRSIESEIRTLETRLASRTVSSDELRDELDRMQDQTRTLSGSQEEALEQLTEQIETTSEMQERLEDEIQKLEEAREEAMQAERETARQEATKLIENELESLHEQKGELEYEVEKLRLEREEIEVSRERLDEKRENLESKVEEIRESVEVDDSAEGLDGKNVVTKETARLFEMDYIGRFDITMREVEEIHTPDRTFEIPEGYWEGRSKYSENVANFYLDIPKDENPWSYPTGKKARYEITSSRFLGLSQTKEMVIEAIVHSNLDAYINNGFDATPAGLDDLLSVVNKVVREAEGRECPHLVGIASPTGWTDEVEEQVRNKEVARTRYSRYLSLCLVDLQNHELIYDETDELVRENTSLFEPPVNAERMKECEEVIRDEYVADVGTHSVLLEELVDEHGFDEHVVKRTFNSLEGEGVGDQLYLDEYGLSLEVEQ